MLVLRVEIVVAGADYELGLRAQAAEIFPHHDGLGAAVDQRGQVEMIAGHHHHVEIRSNIEDPVELRQRIMQIGYQEEAHWDHCRQSVKAEREGDSPRPKQDDGIRAVRNATSPRHVAA